MSHSTPTKNSILMGSGREYKNEEPSIDSAARNALLNNNMFATFVNRMHAVKRVFLVKKKRESNVEIIAYPEIEDNNPESDLYSAYLDAESKWLDCCLREFLERRFRVKSNSHFYFRVVLLLIMVMSFLWYFWPLWGFLIDVEAEAHFKVLSISSGAQPHEIKRAYREAVRRWHPDRNPNCDTCRIQMIKIQLAHDVLLARGSQRFELAEKYREELLQLRSLVFFRLYDMAFYAAQELYYLFRGIYIRRADTDDKHKGFDFFFRVGCRVLTMGLFTMYEFLYISGLNIVVILQVFYYCVSVTRISVVEQEISRMVKHSYFDFYKEAVIFAGIPFFLHFLQQFLGKGGDIYGEDGLEFFFRASFGVLYVLSHLYRMTPNIWDNFVMGKCSIPLTYLRLPATAISFQRVLFTEFGIVLDDLFAFTCRVPSIFRLSVIILHVTFLCQLSWLPHDPPVTVSLGQKYEGKILKEKSRVKKTSKPISDCEVVESSRHDLSLKERALIENLDDELMTWLDVVTIKYKTRIDAAAAAAASVRQERSSIKFDLAPTSNLQEVVFLSIVQTDPNSPVKINILFRVKDEVSSRCLALQRGPFGCIAMESSERINPNLIALKYATLTGKEGSYTPSEIWRSKLVRTKLNSENDNGAVMLIGLIVLFLICLMAFSQTLPVKDHLNYSTNLTPFQQPLRDRWRAFLPMDHILRRSGTGLITLFGRVLCFVDIWDALVMKHV